MDKALKCWYHARPKEENPMKRKVFILPDARKSLKRRFSKSHVLTQARRVADENDRYMIDGKSAVVAAGSFGYDPLSPMIYIFSGYKSIIIATKQDACRVAESGDHGLLDMVREASRRMSDAN